MGAPVEARSLSSLNQLLANPPQYPRNPTHKIQRPLILYIVRVPGSKDVFLTPLKPPTKASISLEAIQSSLYYLHVNTLEDEEVRQSLDEERYARRTENIAPQVTRKPLPASPTAQTHTDIKPLNVAEDRIPLRDQDGWSRDPASAIQLSRLELARASSENNRRSQSIPRKPLQASSSQLSTESEIQEGFSVQQYDSSMNGSGWRPPHMSQIPKIGHEYSPNLRNLTIQTAGGGQSMYSNPASSSRPNRWSQPPPRSMPDNRWNQSPVRSARTMSPMKRTNAPATITLIRRDPVSGAQWNIGTIDQLDSNTFDSVLKPVCIELETPGYGKFVRQLEYPRPGSSRSTASSIKQAMASGGFQDLQFNSEGLPTFARTVEFRQQLSANRPFLQNRPNSFDQIPNSPIQNKPPRSVFSFNSPWQGLCTFSNGIDGKSLKCKHTLPSTNSQEEGIAANVAELRFNLPWSVLGQRDATKKSASSEPHSETDTPPISSLLKEPKSGKEAWRRSVQHLRNISKDLNKRDRSGIENAYAANAGYPMGSNTSSPPLMEEKQEQDPHRLSLKLGREKAGGGFKGNSAKLGKLIIEDEGLKMGDLVVAACMSVWWQHYAGGVGR